MSGYKLGNNVKVGQKIHTNHGWRKILSKDENGVMVKEGRVEFGSKIFGWKAK